MYTEFYTLKAYDSSKRESKDIFISWKDSEIITTHLTYFSG